jgi:hypothetical protein
VVTEHQHVLVPGGQVEIGRFHGVLTETERHGVGGVDGVGQLVGRETVRQQADGRSRRSFPAVCRPGRESFDLVADLVVGGVVEHGQRDVREQAVVGDRPAGLVGA